MSISRRNVLKAAGALPLAGAAGRLQAFAGPFEAQEGHLVPADKKLDPKWVKSLTERGSAQILSGLDLRYIGMPIGGFFAGTVYMGGDGQLWNWDIFNRHHVGTVSNTTMYKGQPLAEGGGANYVDPPRQTSPFDLTFLLDGRPLNAFGKWRPKFLGQYPVANVWYEDLEGKFEVELEAMSPFCPHDVEGSSFPATLLTYKVKNLSAGSVRTAFGFRLEHPVVAVPDLVGQSVAVIEPISADGWVGTNCHIHPRKPLKTRPDIPVADWEDGTYGAWSVEGTAFGTKPCLVKDMPSYMGPLNAEGKYVANTHNTRQGENVVVADTHLGKLTSPKITANRDYLSFKVGGGSHAQKTCVNLLVDGVVSASVTGKNSNFMTYAFFDLRNFVGKQFQVEVVDAESGGWGQISADEFVLTDDPAAWRQHEKHPGFGSFAVLVKGNGVPQMTTEESISRPRANTSLTLELAPGESTEFQVIVAWHYPNLDIPSFPGHQRWYASKWKAAHEVAAALIPEFDSRTALTKKWRDTWYDSTLPYWLLDRTFSSISTLATNTCHRFSDGRFWFWEGIGCCHGTCTHVWAYAQGIGRVFPEIERYLREKVDFGLAWHEDGAIDYRAEFGQNIAHDGQCGCILRTYREHLMSPDDSFLMKVWPKVKLSLQRLIVEDKDKDGLLEGAQYNTLDAAWYGPMAWMSGLYLAAVKAGGAMARIMEDTRFAEECESIAATGLASMEKKLWNGEYFIHIPDKNHPETNSTGNGCHSDQLYGHMWAKQVGLDGVVTHQKAKSALAAIFKYNFAPDVGVYRNGMKDIPGGRWYAVEGEAGMIVTTFPRGGAKDAIAKGDDRWATMYFNETWTGFEYQVASCMVHEGLLTEGLAITRAAHDRHSPSRRNPYNEIECSDHYGRALSAYGVYVAVTGLKTDGPKGVTNFDPQISADDFKCAFVDAVGWGTYIQKRIAGRLERHTNYLYRTDK